MLIGPYAYKPGTHIINNSILTATSRVLRFCHEYCAHGNPLCRQHHFVSEYTYGWDEHVEQMIGEAHLIALQSPA